MKTHKFRTTLIVTLTNLFISTFAFAQSPEAISYQAMARNSMGVVLANQSVSFRISLLQGSITGTAVYKERHAVSTNQFGLANLEIGSGTILSGSFSGIDWGANTYYLKVELDPTGGTNYQAMGVSQLLSVPYSLYSKESNRSEAPWISSGNNIYYGSGYVGIGTNNPLSNLHIKESTEGKASIIGERANSTQRFGFISTGGLRIATSEGDITINPGQLSTSNTLSSGTDVMRIKSSGKIGIGTSTPEAGLQINNYSSFNTWRVMLRLQSTGGASEAITFFDTNSGWLIGHTTGTNSFYWRYFSSVSPVIGDTKMCLTKDGLLGVCEIKVETAWCDYVFDEKYKLMDLTDLERFIKTQKHLPGIPTASQIENDGLYVGDMSKKMMEKIEELTLYVIELNKAVEELKKENESLKKQLKHSKH
ncbi:MAG TPA: hypothetical protein PLZ52_11385 [Bacteroidales bacterium]|nr:hypothetical protein [Bacteroidales bacterium]